VSQKAGRGACEHQAALRVQTPATAVQKACAGERREPVRKTRMIGNASPDDERSTRPPRQQHAVRRYSRDAPAQIADAQPRRGRAVTLPTARV